MCKGPEAGAWLVQEKHLRPVWPGPAEQWERSTATWTSKAMRRLLFFIPRAEGAAEDYDTRKGHSLICPLNRSLWRPVNTQGPQGSEVVPGLGRRE